MMKLLQVFSRFVRNLFHSEIDESPEQPHSLLTKSERPKRGSDKKGKADRAFIDSSEFLESKEKTLTKEHRITKSAGIDKKSSHKTKKKSAIRVKRAPLDVWAGLDFGTSSVKVAYRRMDATNRVYPVDFKHKLKSFPSYCLPSLIVFKDSRILLGIEAAKYVQTKPWDSGIRRLKILVAAEVSDDFTDLETKNKYEGRIHKFNRSSHQSWRIETLTVLLLAHAMQSSYSLIRKQLKGHNLDIRFNVCAPIDYIERNAVKQRYDRIVDVAYKLFQENIGNRNLDVSSTFVDDKLKNWTRNSDQAQKRVFLIPESVAEIASYLTSLEVRKGIHALIDFGAGTTDISIFNLMGSTQSQHRPIWYSAKVLPHGSNLVEKIVAKYLENQGGSTAICTDQAVMKTLEQLKQATPEIQIQVRSQLERLWKSCCPVWGQAYGHLKRQSEWTKDNIKIMISGGACRLPYIESVFRESWMDKSSCYRWGPYPIEVLPSPDDYIDNGTGAPFERMSVAYGLTIPEPELNEYVLPSQAPDHTPPPLPIREGKHNRGWANY